MSAGNGAQYLDSYLNEIGQIGLLTAEQEIELSKAIRGGNKPEAARAEIHERVKAAFSIVAGGCKRMPIPARNERGQQMPADALGDIQIPS